MKKPLGLLLSLITFPLLAINITITPPVFGGNNPHIDDINSGIENNFRDLERDIMNEIGNINTNPQKLIRAFATTSVFASAAATQRSYGGYDNFAFTIGPMIGLQLPVSPFSFMDEIENIGDRLENEGDIKAGFNPQLLNAQFSINTSKLLLNNLYLGLKFGYMSFDIEEFTFKTSSIGAIGSFQLFTHKKLTGALLLWRGINLGTGFIYQKTNLEYSLPMETYDYSFATSDFYSGDSGDPIYSHTIKMTVAPQLNMNFDINTYTIPLEVMTSIRLLGFLNLSFGLGADIGFGNASLSVSGEAEPSFTGLPNDIHIVRPASLAISMGGNNTPNIFNPKIMIGLGFSFGPVIIDFPFTYYFQDQGYNAGITLGIVW
jgi:hypothetical protein